MNLDNIPKSEQKDFLASFWTMLKECDEKADDNADPVLRHWVSCWFQQWNKITGQNHAPSWVKRAIAKNAPDTRELL